MARNKYTQPTLILKKFKSTLISRHKEYSALVESAAKKNGKNLSSELELELRNGEKSSGEELGGKSVPGVIEGGDEVKTEELGMKDLFSKELWLITVVMWLIWPISKLSLLHNHSKKILESFQR